MKTFKELREKYRSKYPASLVAAAVKIAIDMGGAMTPAVKKIEAMKRGLSNDPIVKDALRMANESVNEGLSKKLSNPEIKKLANKYKMGDAEIADLKNDYSPAKTARPKAWLSLDYPVRDGDYYFAFISSNEKDNVKFNNLLNDVIKKAAKEVPAGEKLTDKADYIWDKASAAVKKFPRALGWNDTMAREEIWASIGHLIGVREEIEELAIDKMRVGKRRKAPKWS